MPRSTDVIEPAPDPIPELDTVGTPSRSGRAWFDRDGFVGPVQPGTGPRRDPAGDAPSGPAVGQRLPDIHAVDPAGSPVDVHRHRDGKPAVVNFYRSAVW